MMDEVISVSSETSDIDAGVLLRPHSLFKVAPGLAAEHLGTELGTRRRVAVRR
jgi:hypothetical protein